MSLQGVPWRLVVLFLLTFSISFSSVSLRIAPGQAGSHTAAALAGLADGAPQLSGNLLGQPLLSASESPPAVAPFLDKPAAGANQSAAQSVKINEVELNPPGGNDSRPWFELYNPTPNVVPLDNYMIKTLNNSTISFARGAAITPGGFYTQFVPGAQISNIADMLVLYNSSGEIASRTPLLIDRFHDSRTWQRIPDGSNEWMFANETMGHSNSPSALANFTGPTSSFASARGVGFVNSTASCGGTAGCAVGTVIRIAGPNSVYLQLNSTIYKIQLALVSSTAVARPGGSGESAISILETYCLGNSALIDQDDGNPAAGNSIVAAVYCSGLVMNGQLLLSGAAQLDSSQCGISEFAGRDWAKAAGC